MQRHTYAHGTEKTSQVHTSNCGRGPETITLNEVATTNIFNDLPVLELKKKLASSGRRSNIVCRGPGFWWTMVGSCLSEEIRLLALTPANPFSALDVTSRELEIKYIGVLEFHVSLQKV